MLSLLLAVGVLAGAVLPIQAAINGQLARHMGGAITATAISFAAGATLLWLAVAVLPRETSVVDGLKATPPWLLVTGGLLGALYLASSVFIVPRIGAAATFAAVIAGQLVTVLVLDHFGLFGLAERTASPGRIAGVALVFAGAVMVRFL